MEERAKTRIRKSLIFEYMHCFGAVLKDRSDEGR